MKTKITLTVRTLPKKKKRRKSLQAGKFQLVLSDFLWGFDSPHLKESSSFSSSSSSLSWAGPENRRNVVQHCKRVVAGDIMSVKRNKRGVLCALKIYVKTIYTLVGCSTSGWLGGWCWCRRCGNGTQ
jgi:hypothetical protein